MTSKQTTALAALCDYTGSHMLTAAELRVHPATLASMERAGWVESRRNGDRLEWTLTADGFGCVPNSWLP